MKSDSAQREGTKQSKEVRTKIRWVMKLVFGCIAVVLFTIWLLGFREHGGVHSPTANSEVSSAHEDGWRVVTLPPDGWSPAYARPRGMHILVKGDGIMLYSQYSNGTKCPSSESCPARPISNSVKNLTNYENTILVKFEKD